MDSILQSMYRSTPIHDLCSQDGFISSLLHPRYCVSSSPATDLCHDSAADASKSLVVDAGKFLAERNLIGQFQVNTL